MPTSLIKTLILTLLLVGLGVQTQTVHAVKTVTYSSALYPYLYYWNSCSYPLPSPPMCISYWGLYNGSASITFKAKLVTTGGVEIADGASLPVGTQFRVVRDTSTLTSDTSFNGTGWYNGGSGTIGTAYGRFVASAGAPATACSASDLFSTASSGTGSSKIYEMFNVNPPATTVASLTTGTITCSGDLCTVNTAGSGSVKMDFSGAYGKFYYQLAESYDGWACHTSDGAWQVPMTQSAKSAYVYTVPTQTITFNVTATAPADNASCSSMSVPASVVAGAIFTGNITMNNSGATTWSSVSGYQLYSQTPTGNTTWGTNNVALATSVAPGANVTFSRSFTAPVTAGTYTFAWQMNKSGVGFGSTCSQSITVTNPPPPSTPTGLTATPNSCGTGRIDISWGAVSGATSYQLVDTTSGITVYSGASTAFAHTGLTAGSSHSYKVRATNGGGSSAYSAIISATAPSACPPPPPTPTGLTATPNSCGTGRIDISWGAASGATSYQLVDTTSGITVYSGASTAFAHTGLVAGSSHSYKVRATNGGVSSLYSAIISAVAPPVCSPPSTPTGLTATPGACGTAVIDTSWTAVSGAISYKLYDGSALIYSNTSSSFTHTGLVAGSSHSYKVLSTNATGNSATSTVVSATAPVACVVATPNLVSQNLTFSAGPYTQGTSISLTAEVQNAGTAKASPNFYDNFTYQWGGTSGTWLTFVGGDNILHDDLAVGATSVDTATFIPAQSGTLYIQHCVDSTGLINEGVNETPNCTVSAGMAVSSAPVSSITASSCSIAVGSNNCNSTVNWNTTEPTPIYVKQDGVTFATNVLSSMSTQNIGYGTHTFSIYKDTSLLVSATANATCASASVWDTVSGTCISAITGSLTVDGSSLDTTRIVGNSVTVGWNVTGGGVGCFVQPHSATWTGTSGSQSEVLSTTVTYILGCSNVSGPLDSLTVTVGQVPVLTASKRTVEQGSTVTLDWDISGNDPATCSLSGGALDASYSSLTAYTDPVTYTGSVAVVVSAKTTYTLTCSSGSDTQIIEIVPRMFET